MKLTINRDLLLKAVRRCDLKASHTGNPALACVALHATRIADMPGGLDLKATNGLTGIATMVACDTQEEHALAIHCKTFAQAIATMPSGTLTLQSEPLKGGAVRLIVKGGQRTWKGLTRPVSDVKDLPEPADGTRQLKLTGTEFLTMLDRTRFAVGDVGAEHIWRQGIYLDVSSRFNAVVIGDHLCARYETARGVAGGDFRLLLPELFLPYARELALEDEKGVITMTQGEHFAWLESTATMLVMNPPPGEYLDWRKALTSLTQLPVCRLPRLAVIETLRAMLSTSPSSITPTWLRLLPTGDLRFDYHHADGEVFFHDTIPVSDIKIDSLPIFMVDAKLLLDAVEASGTDPVLSHVDTGRHIVLTTEEGFFWAGGLLAPETGARPPSLDDTPAPPAPVAPAAEAATPKRAGRKPSEKGA